MNQKTIIAVSQLHSAVVMLDEYRRTTRRHGLMDLMLYEELLDREKEGLLSRRFEGAGVAMAHIIETGLTMDDTSVFGDDSFMQYEHDAVFEFLYENDLILSEPD